MLRSLPLTFLLIGCSQIKTQIDPIEPAPPQNLSQWTITSGDVSDTECSLKHPTRQPAFREIAKNLPNTHYDMTSQEFQDAIGYGADLRKGDRQNTVLIWERVNGDVETNMNVNFTQDLVAVPQVLISVTSPEKRCSYIYAISD